jgi:catechol 2,3-dioxygenase-like lactoylglutathione lyase family enzyme
MHCRPAAHRPSRRRLLANLALASLPGLALGFAGPGAPRAAPARAPGRAAGDAGTPTARPPASGAIVAQIDHVVIESTDPAALFALFTDTLQLPVAWPFAAYPGFASGGAFLGNANVEALILGDPATPAAAAPGRARLAALAFEPAGTIDAAIAELESRGLPYEAPQEIPGPRGWVNVTVNGLVPGPAAFPPTFLVKYTFDQDRVRADLRQDLLARGGGPLGLERLAEVVVGATDPTAAARRWQAFLTPIAPAGTGYWAIGAGPALRLELADDDAILALVLQISSLATAEGFLRERGLLGEAGDGWVALAPEATQGVAIQLCEACA